MKLLIGDSIIGYDTYDIIKNDGTTLIVSESYINAPDAFV